MPPRKPVGPLRKATDAMIAALEREERLTPVDAARVAAFRALADVLDEHPTYSRVWAEYRAVEERLHDAKAADDDEFDKLLQSLRPTVRDEAQPGAPNSRQ